MKTERTEMLEEIRDRNWPEGHQAGEDRDWLVGYIDSLEAERDFLVHEALPECSRQCTGPG